MANTSTFWKRLMQPCAMHRGLACCLLAAAAMCCGLPAAHAEIQMKKGPDGSIMLFNERKSGAEPAEQESRQAGSQKDETQAAPSGLAQPPEITKQEALNNLTAQYNEQLSKLQDKKGDIADKYAAKLEDIEKQQQQKQEQIRLADTQDRDARKRFLMFEYTKLSRKKEEIVADRNKEIKKLDDDINKLRRWYDAEKEAVEEKFDGIP